MEREEVSHPRRVAISPSPRAVLTARVLMWVASASALVAALTGLAAVLDAGAARLMAETWRLYGFLVFAALYALLAYRPLGYRWLWEIVILNKLLLAVTAGGFVAGVIGPGDVAGAPVAAIADGALVLITVTGYVLCRGWRAAPGPGLRESGAG